MSSGRVRRRAALALVFGAALTTGAATGAWHDPPGPGDRPPEVRPRLPQPVGPAAGVPLPAPRTGGSGVPDGTALDAAAARDLLSVLDDRWAAYYPPETAGEYRETVDGAYPGVGLTVSQASGAMRATYVSPNGPAARAGIAAGDALVSVDGAPTDELGTAGVVARLRGPAGTRTELVVVRDGVPHTVGLVREVLTGADVTAEPVGPAAARLLCVRVTGFGRGTADQVRAALATKPAGVLLDLRGNPGGRIDEAAAVASAFLPGGVVVSYDDGTGGRRQITVTGRPGDAATPVVVLVDGATASAAEVVAAALGDRGRAVVVGATTYGKGSVQAPTTLADGGILKLTVGRWYTPDGRNLEGRGIDPDIPVPPGTDPDAAAARARDVLAGLVDAGTDA
ncbi:S41 family peptidase [Yinghuangia seranimata]|uniref:S41 family peptidase n=1 Tax=Yinghuangia seranimata TaxID=408067 RepID=UPI00248ABBE0|nr:S41 family peptidase [Yinghuangia seranimata]MDI2131412.1 S41 family peptidase [Yinghuangia seranimata]